MPKGERNRKLSDTDRTTLVQRYTTPNADGTWDGCKVLSREFGISPNAVIWNLRRAGITIRTAHEARVGGKRCKPITHVPTDTAPPCKCGCGIPTQWDQHANRWQVYAPGHYRKPAPYKDRDWLEHEYTFKQRMLAEIAQDCGVAINTILKAMKRHGLARRPNGESLTLSGAVRGHRNPAFKDGRAKWDYTWDWKLLSRAIRKRDGYRCRLCGIYLPPPSKRLHVHHIDSDRFNNAESNLITVCATCHPKGKHAEQHLAESLD